MPSLLDMAAHGGGDDDAPPDAPEGMDDGEARDEAGRAAMKAFIHAVHSKDEEAAWDALKAAVANCPEEPEEGDGGEEGDHEGGGPHTALLLMPHPKR